MQRRDQIDRLARPGDDLVDIAPQCVALVDMQRLVHAAGNDAGAVDALADDVADDLLAPLARHHAALGEIGEGRCDADDVALADFAVEAEQQVGRGEIEEMQRVRLDELPVVKQPTQLLGGRSQRAVAGDEVHRLGGGEVVADRADAAQALHRDRHLPIRPAFDEDLEATKLDDMEADLMDAILFVEQDRHLAVPFDAGHRFDGDATQLVRRFRGFEIQHRAALNRNSGDCNRDAACARG